ncbi:acyl-CoA N-acyltransferase [Stipitochalara longipes BDJ]|nr:acyl-CoA N-acyltransferase [Stipitochalara longipes BDJ]
MALSSTLVVSEATLPDIPAIKHIFARAFYPISPYMAKAMPDTPQMAEWWGRVNQAAIEDSKMRLIKVTETALSAEVIAICRWRVAGSFGRDAGFWTEFPLTPYHNTELCESFIKPMGEYRRKLMGDRPHYFLEFLASAHEHKGRGIGSMLVQWGCDRADEEDVEIYVETNRAVLPLYKKFGFIVQDTLAMPGGFGYEEFFLVRPRSSTSGHGSQRYT